MREKSRPCAHGPRAEPAPRQPPQTLTFVYCLSAFGVRPREGRGAASRARPGQRPSDAGGRRRAGPRARPSGAAWTRVPQRRPGGACVLAAHRPLAFPSESFAVGTSPRCAGRRAPEAEGRAGRGVPGGRSWAPGCEPEQQPRAGRGSPRRLPPPPLRDSGSSARRTGATFPLRLYSERGSLSSPHPRPSFPCPPFPSLSCLHHP